MQTRAGAGAFFPCCGHAPFPTSSSSSPSSPFPSAELSPATRLSGEVSTAAALAREAFSSAVGTLGSAFLTQPGRVVAAAAASKAAMVVLRMMRLPLLVQAPACAKRRQRKRAASPLRNAALFSAGRLCGRLTPSMLRGVRGVGGRRGGRGDVARGGVAGRRHVGGADVAGGRVGGRGVRRHARRVGIDHGGVDVDAGRILGGIEVSAVVGVGGLGGAGGDAESGDGDGDESDLLHGIALLGGAMCVCRARCRPLSGAASGDGAVGEGPKYV